MTKETTSTSTLHHHIWYWCMKAKYILPVRPENPSKSSVGSQWIFRLSLANTTVINITLVHKTETEAYTARSLLQSAQLNIRFQWSKFPLTQIKLREYISIQIKRNPAGGQGHWWVTVVSATQQHPSTLSTNDRSNLLLSRTKSQENHDRLTAWVPLKVHDWEINWGGFHPHISVPSFSISIFS